MKIGVGILIFLVATIALVAEIILYFMFGIGAAVTGEASSVIGVAAFFVWLMFMTVIVGVMSPIAALIEQVTKKENLSLYILLPTVGIAAIGIGGILLFTSYTAHKSWENDKSVTTDKNSNITTTSAVTSTGNANNADSAYIDKIEIKNLKVGTSVLQEPAVFGEIKNKGDRTIKSLDLVIYFLDKDGNIVAEKEYSPIFPSEYSFGNDSSPLKPNYARKFGYRAQDAPSDWNRKVEVKVVKVELE